MNYADDTLIATGTNRLIPNMESRDVGALISQGIAGVFGALVLAYSGHWWGKAVASEEKQLAEYR
ncbi:hypothetical protein, partial [Pseudomonas synxantha]|uniref:hypothetical protein n=1 Tax=Pseudomonas synxantha TaxID=47883 RepID=UPI00345C677B